MIAQHTQTSESRKSFAVKEDGVFRRHSGTVRDLLRWASQIAALLIIGFWKNSPLTIAKITGFVAGYFPVLGATLSVYLLIPALRRRF